MKNENKLAVKTCHAEGLAKAEERKDRKKKDS
jgi:hypothetical protein